MSVFATDLAEFVTCEACGERGHGSRRCVVVELVLDEARPTVAEEFAEARRRHRELRAAGISTRAWLETLDFGPLPEALEP